MVPLIVNIVLYLGGCFLIVLYRAFVWAAKQAPGEATWGNFHRQRLWSNLASLVVGLLGTGVWVDGHLSRWVGFGADAGVTYAISPLAGAVVTFLSRFIIKGLETRAAAAAGGAPDKEE